MDKYDKDQEFCDPVVRCDSCSKVILTKTLRMLGMCTCGNRKVRSLQTYTSDELAQMIAWDIDPKFIALFEGRTDVV
jgi:hypothetical protein